MNPLLHVQDDQSKPNFPQENNAPDYIKQFNNIENTIKQNKENVEQNNFMDNDYITKPLF